MLTQDARLLAEILCFNAERRATCSATATLAPRYQILEKWCLLIVGTTMIV